MIGDAIEVLDTFNIAGGRGNMLDSKSQDVKIFESGLSEGHIQCR